MASLARIPWAIWDPISGRSTAPNRPVRMTVHITAVRADDIYGPGKGPGGTYAHCHNSRDGDFRQHQELNRMGQADLDGNGETVAIENEGREGDELTAKQIDNLARAFAFCVRELGVPNRIATVGDTRGLAWHRLGVSGNFGAYSYNDMTTWSRAQTGKQWTRALGKTCPTDRVIRQIPLIFARAQDYISKGVSPARPGDDDDMPTAQEIAKEVWGYGFQAAEFDGQKIPADTAGQRVLALRKLAARQDRRAAETLILARGYEAALDALAKAQGADAAAITKTVRASVDKALADLSITLTTEKGK